MRQPLFVRVIGGSSRLVVVWSICPKGSLRENGIAALLRNSLRERMIEDSLIRDLSAGSQLWYMQPASRFIRYCCQTPQVSTPDENCLSDLNSCGACEMEVVDRAKVRQLFVVQIDVVGSILQPCPCPAPTHHPCEIAVERHFEHHHRTVGRGHFVTVELNNPLS